MPATVSFLRAARDQAHQLTRRFVAHLMLHRRTQTRVAVSVSFVIAVVMMVVSPAGDSSARTDRTPACPTATIASAVVPTDWRVVALPRDVIAPRMKPGDRVDVVSQATVIAGDAVVVNSPTETDGVVVAVPPGAAAMVATSAQNGDVSVVGHG